MGNRNIVFGRLGEDRAADYLRGKGYEIIQRNYRCRYGEIDIIALDRDILCFIEVKTRTSVRYGCPCEAVNLRKRQHIEKSAYDYMGNFKGAYKDIRMEIVELLCAGGRFYIRHIMEY